MAYEATSVDYAGTNVGTFSFTATATADIASLPITADVATGSTCIIVGAGTDNGDVYMLAADRVWRKL